MLTAPDRRFDLGFVGPDRARRTRKLIVLGASGSVGKTTIRFLQSERAKGGAGRDPIQLTGVSVHKSTDQLISILNEFDVRFACVSDAAHAAVMLGDLRREFPGVTFFGGAEGLVEIVHAAADAGADTVLTAVVGAVGIHATMAGVERGLKIALANKETLVTAGPAILKACRTAAVRPSVLPVDSEHNAVFQLLNGADADSVSDVVITASGGPFRGMSNQELSTVSLAQVLNHPTWRMGPKITVDSASMVNKGLEVIEAHFLFGVDYAHVGVLIHPKSVVHAMLRTHDGAFLMAASKPDMVFPIAHSLLFPDAVTSGHVGASAPDTWPALDFFAVAEDSYPAFHLCLAAGRRGGTAPALLNAANESAVDLLLRGIIQFTDIPSVIGMVLDQIPAEDGEELGLFLEADRRARRLVEEKKGAAKTF